MKAIYELIEQSTNDNDYYEKLVLEGSYNECLKGLEQLEKGYISFYKDNQKHIVKTKGWRFKGYDKQD